jgi:hypothetical protein
VNIPLKCPSGFSTSRSKTIRPIGRRPTAAVDGNAPTDGDAADIDAGAGETDAATLGAGADLEGVMDDDGLAHATAVKVRAAIPASRLNRRISTSQTIRRMVATRCIALASVRALPPKVVARRAV